MKRLPRAVLMSAVAAVLSASGCALSPVTVNSSANWPGNAAPASPPAMPAYYTPAAYPAYYTPVVAGQPTAYYAPVAAVPATPVAQMIPALPAAPAAPAPVVFTVSPFAVEQAKATNALDEAMHSLDGISLFFETGQAVLTKEGRLKLAKLADVLKRNPDLKVRIEGNADERGTADLNRQLGAQRATAARDLLISFQVSPGQISTISNGADKPVAPGHSETAWELNRRDDVVPVGSSSTASPNAATPTSTTTTSTTDKK